MKLYLVIRTDPVGYDEYDSAVVAAEDEDTARLIHPSGDFVWNGTKWRHPTSTWDYVSDTWADPASLIVEEIGLAHPSLIRGVVCASFNAG